MLCFRTLKRFYLQKARKRSDGVGRLNSLKKEDVLEWAKTQDGQTDYSRLAMYFYNFDEITENIIAKFFMDTGDFTKSLQMRKQ